MKNKILKKINVEEIMEEIKKNPEENGEFKVFWNGKKIEVDLEYYDFEKEIDEIKEKLENLKTLVENAEEWDKKIKDAAGEYILEDAQYWWEPSSDYEDEDIPNLINDIEKYIGKEEADNLRNGNFTREAFKNLLYVSSITMDNNGCFNVGLFDIDYIMFGGHILFIDGNINGEFYGGDMAG